MSDKIELNKLAQDAAIKAGVSYTDLVAFVHGYMLGSDDSLKRIKVLEEALEYYAGSNKDHRCFMFDVMDAVKIKNGHLVEVDDRIKELASAALRGE